MKYAFPAILSPEEDGRFSVWFPDLRGCATSGVDLPDAIECARDALGLWLDGAQRHGIAIPTPSKAREIALEESQDVTLVDVDLTAYRASLNERAVKKTLSIPGWLNAMSERENINYSQVLQDGLKERLGVSD